MPGGSGTGAEQELGGPAARSPTPTGARLEVPAVDGFRWFAALAVVLYHCSYGAGGPQLDEGVIRNVFLAGYMGVDFFFVISGFLLFLPTVTAGGRFGDVRSYALRRAARIFPAYWVVLVAAVALHPLLLNQHVDLPYNSWSGLLSFGLHVPLLQHSVGLALGFAEGFLVNGALWTLSLELAFYMLLPFVATRYYRRPFVGFAVALVVSVAWRTAAVNVPFAISFLPGVDDVGSLRVVLVTQFPAYMVQFAAGMTGAWIFVRLRRARTARMAWLTVPVQAAALIGVLLGMRAAGARDAAATAGIYDHFTGTTFVALSFAVLLLATALAPRWAQFPVVNPVARRLGDVSYGVYLWHLLFIGLALHTLPLPPEATTWAFLRLLGFVLAGSILVGWLSFRFVERPCIRWARRRSKQRERAAPEQAPPYQPPHQGSAAPALQG